MTAKQFEEMFPSLANAEAFTVGGRRFVSMDKVLEIIDEESTRNGMNLKQTAEIRRRVVELKGGDEE